MLQKIAKLQNEELPLKMQFTARTLYNTAEIQNYIAWILCIASALLGFFNDGTNIYFSSMIIVFEFIAFILMNAMNKNISIAAHIRNNFDRYVYCLNDTCFNESELHLREKVEHIVCQHFKNYNIQVSNNGNDYPPGVKNWYNTEIKISGDTSPILYMIKENCWWTKKIQYSSLLISLGIAFTGFVLIVITIHTQTLSTAILFIASISGLIIRAIEKTIVIIKFLCKSIQLNSYIENYNSLQPNKAIDLIQGMLEEIRELPLVSINMIHKKMAKRLHHLYSAMHK